MAPISSGTASQQYPKLKTCKTRNFLTLPQGLHPLLWPSRRKWHFLLSPKIESWVSSLTLFPSLLLLPNPRSLPLELPVWLCHGLPSQSDLLQCICVNPPHLSPHISPSPCLSHKSPEFFFLMTETSSCLPFSLTSQSLVLKTGLFKWPEKSYIAWPLYPVFIVSSAPKVFPSSSTPSSFFRMLSYLHTQTQQSPC